MPTPAHNKFAFLVHVRTNVSEDFGRIFKPLGLIPSSWYERFLPYLPPVPRVMSTIRNKESGEVLGEIIPIALTPTQLLGRDRKLVDRHIDAAVAYAAKRGASIVGLGALTAPATGGGNRLRKQNQIAVTNGNAFTAVATYQGIVRMVQQLNEKPTIALVGASGSVGSAVTRLLMQKGDAKKLVLIGRTRGKLAALAAEAPENQEIQVSLDIADSKQAQIVVLMTSAKESLLKSEHLAPNAYVLDDTQPRNTSPELLIERPDITLIDGGMVMTPGLKRKGMYIGIPSHMSFACLAETALLALDRHVGHGVIGDPTLEQVNHMENLAARFSSLGFHLAPPTAFGEQIEIEHWNEVTA